jgi:YD repeat-containing protein
MPEQAREQITIDAPVEACFDTLVDFEQYPDWVGDLKDVAVVERDEHGRGRLVEFRAAGMGRSTTYRLRYDYDGAPHRLGWTLAEGDITRAIDGAYLLRSGGEGSTDVEYELSIDLIMPIPGFVKRRAEDRIIKSALQALKARVESTRA